MRSTNPRVGLRSSATSLVLLPALLLACPSAPAQALCRPESLLVASASFATSFLPRNIVVADFNGDGILDLATATSHWNPPHRDAVAVLLGNGANRIGDGTFRGPVFYSAGRGPVAVAAGDFNADRILDLAVLNQGAGSVSILRGRGSGGVGDGTFALQSSLDTGPDPIDIVAGDFREDGFTDLAVLHALFGVRILAGSAAGSFTVAQNVPVPGAATGNLVSGDFNRDGVLDLVFALAGSIAVLYGRGVGGVGNGSFNSPTGYSGPGAFDVADMNRDGLPDLVMAGGGPICIALGRGGGGFMAPVPISPGYYAGPVRVADLDRDGSLDIVAGSGSALLAFCGLGTRGAPYDSFEYPELLSPGFFTQCLALGDFDSDGRPDVAAGRIDAAANTARLEVLLGRCANAPPPILDAIEDVPNDEGGRVRLSWRRSAQDGLAGDAVTSYDVLQRDPGSVSWRVVRNLPATRQNSYVLFAATAQDSTPAGAPPTSFYVSGLTADPSVHYDSEVLSGYSKDNIAPPMATDFSGELVPAEGILLRWSPVAAADVARYRVHRVPLTTYPAAPPADGNRIAALAGTEFLDRGAGAASDVVWYWLAAEDAHGNLAPWSADQLFTSACERGVNLVRNNTSAPSLAAKPVGWAAPAGESPLRPPPVLKPRDPPPAYLSTYATALDTTISDPSGTGRLRYDLRAGQLHADASSPAGRKSVEVVATDTYRVLGPENGTPVDVSVELDLHAASLDLCSAPPCGGGNAQVAVQTGVIRAEVSLEVGASSAPSRDTTLHLSIPVAADAPFAIYFDVHVTGALSGAGGVSADGRLRFPGLPSGARVTSCGGYESDAIVPVQLTLVAARATPDAADLRWFSADRSAATATLYRSADGGEWRSLTEIVADGLGYLHYVDRAVTPGRRYGYRLGVLDGDSERTLGEVWVEIPLAARLSLAPPSAEPTSGALRVTFTLESSRPAVLQIFDLAGRRLFRQEVGALGPGEHHFELTDARGWPAGLYFVSLAQDGRSVSRRVGIVR